MTLNKTLEPSRRAAVYRLYDAEGTLLYIGSAYDPDEREAVHRHTVWGQLIACRSDKWHDSRELAYAAETEAIRAEAPRHNVIGTPNHTGPQERGHAMREAAAARWRAVRQSRSSGASREEARREGARAEIEFLEATGMFRRYVANMRKTFDEGGTLTQWSMSID